MRGSIVRQAAAAACFAVCASRSAAQSADDAVGFGAAADGGRSTEVASQLTAAGFARSELSGILPERQQPTLRYGRLTLEAALTYQYSQLTLVAGLHAETDVVTSVEAGGLPPSERQTNGTYLLPWELYARQLLGPVTLAAGRQIVAFGNALFFPLLDVANPRDMRVPLLGVPAERREPLLMARIAFDEGPHRFELIGVFEADYRFRPPPFAPYSPVNAVIQRELAASHRTLLTQIQRSDATYRHDGQGVVPEATQALLRYRFDGWGPELGVYGGWVVHNEGILGFPSTDRWTQRPIPLPVAHPHYFVVGASFTGALGPFLTYLEVLGELWKPIGLGDLDAPTPTLTSQRQSWLRGTFGIRYDGIEDGMIALETTAGATSHVEQLAGFEPLLPVAPWNIAGTYRQSFWRQQLEVEWVGLVLGPQPALGGYALRVQIGVRPFDALRLQVAYVVFTPGRELSLISGFERARIDANLRWDFALP